VTVLLKDCYDIDYSKYVTALGAEAVEKVLSKLWDLKRGSVGGKFPLTSFLCQLWGTTDFCW
jgi:hypothetical protein